MKMYVVSFHEIMVSQNNARAAKYSLKVTNRTLMLNKKYNPSYKTTTLVFI